MFSISGNCSIKLWKIQSHPEKVLNIKPFRNKYNWERINYPSKIDDWKTSEENNATISLKILYIEEKDTLPACISKTNLNYEKQIILLVIPKEQKEGWYYLVVKTTSKHYGDFYCLIYLHSFRIKNKFKSHEKVCKNRDFCGIVMPSEKNNISEFSQYMNSDKQYTLDHPCTRFNENMVNFKNSLP